MSDETPPSPQHSHPPHSDELPKDALLEMSDSSIEIEQTISDEIASFEETSKNHPLENIPKYPAIHTLSLFANLAYEKREEIQSALVKVEGWQLLTTAQSENGYFGAVFWHPANHQIVIAHRGTDPSKIWEDVIKVDIRGVYLNNYVDRMSSAATFAEVILTIFEKVEQELNYSIQLFFTGHSLGGWLAQVTTFTTEYLRPMENAGRYHFQNPSGSRKISSWPHHAHTVVFESPGCAGMLRKMRKSFDISSIYRSTDLNTLDITNYLSAPNIINTCNEHLGTCYRLITDLSKSNIDKSWRERVVGKIETLAKCIIHPKQIPDVIFEYTFKTHSKEKIQELLVGKPISELKGKIKEILDWPTLDVPKRKDYKKLFKEDLLHWANNFHIDHVNECVDENGLYGVRYQTKDFDERYGYLSIFTPFERKFLERYVWIQKLGSPVFQPHEWFRCCGKQESRAIELLGDFFIEKNKFHCSNDENSNEIVPLLKRLLKLDPSIDERSQHSITEKGNVKKIFEFEAKSYRENFKRKSSFLNVNAESFGVRDFLVGGTRIWCAIAPGTTGNEKSGMTLVYSALKKILEQKATCFTDDSYTILKLKRFLDLMQQKVDVGHLFEEGRFLMVIDCGKLELDDSDKALFSKLFEVTENKTTVKLILVSSNKLQEKVIMDLIEKHRLDTLCVQTTVTSLKWTDLTSEYQQELLKKPIRLAGSAKIPLKSLLGNDPPPELGLQAMMQLIEEIEVITIGSEPQQLSDLEAAYAKRYVKIEAENLRRAMVRVDNVHTIFIIDGLLSLQALIEKMEVVDDDEVTHLESQMDTNIRLVTDEFSEQEFKQFCHAHPTSQIQWISYKSLNGEWFWKQMYDPRFYVERELNQIADPETIKSILKDKNSTESFVVSGVEYGELLQLIGLNINDEEEKKRVSCRLSAVKKVEDLENDKLNRSDFVHRLKYEVPNGSNVKQLVRQVNASPSLTKEEFHSLRGETLSVIVDHPGMGKSTILTHLTEVRLSRNWVMRLNLKNCSSHLWILSDEPNVDEVIVFLWKATDGEVEAYLAKSVLKYLLENPKADVERPILLLFDGFDEIDEKSQNKIISLLGLLKGIFENSRHQIVITTRRHPDLEKTLQMLYTVEFTPLDREHQIEFLMSHWLRRNELLISNLITAPAKSEQYAKGLLHQADTTLGEKMALFIGIPMQLRLLTEGFRDDFLKFAKSSVHPPAFRSIGLLDIYQFFINAKYSLLYKEKTGFSGLSCPVYERWMRQRLTSIHQHLARTILFSKEDKLFSNYSPQYDELIEIYRLGLIQKIRDREGFEFVHYTFVEYYVADFCFQKLPKLARSPPTDSVKKFFLCDILSKPKYHVVRSFLDKMLIAHGDQIEYAKGSHSRYERDIFLHVAVAEGNCEIVKFILRALDAATVDAPLSLAPDIGDFRCKLPLHIAAAEGNSDIVGLLLARIEENEESKVENFAVNTKDENGNTPLHLAIENGSVEVVQILLNAKHVDVIAISNRKFTPLHFAASRGCSDIVGLLLARIEENEESKVENFAVNAKSVSGETPLHLAIENDNVEVVQILLKAKHVDINAISDCKLTPLHFAILRGHSDIIELLLARIEENEESELENFAVNAKCERGETPLHLAIKNGRVEVVQILLKAKHVDVNAIWNHKLTPLHIAASRGCSDIVGLLLARIEENEKSKVENFAVNAKDEYGETPLHLAIKNGRVEVVQILVKAKHVDVNAICNHKHTPLHIAASRGCSDIVGLLLARIEENEKFKVENFAVNAKDEYGETPLHLAIKNGRVEVVQILVKAKHVDANAIWNCKLMPLHIAASRGCSDLVGLLVAQIEEIEKSKVKNFAVNAKDRFGQTPLHLAIKNGGVEVVQILLKVKHVDVDAITNLGNTPLHIAASRGCSDIVGLLLARIEENEKSKVTNFAVNAKDEDGRAPLHLSIEEEHDEVVRMLLKAKHVDVNAISNFKRTPLHTAALWSQSNIVGLLLARIEENEEFKVENFAVNAKDRFGETPLHLASKNGRVEVAHILLKAKNVDVNSKGGKNDETALHNAIRSSHKNKTKIIQYLLSFEEIDVNVRNKDNMTPLHLASESNQVEIVKTLLAARNIDVNAKGGYDNMTPMQMASDEGYTDVVKLLVKYHG